MRTWNLRNKGKISGNQGTPYGDTTTVDRFWCLRCLNDHINLLDMIGSLASGATASLVGKNGTKKLSQPFEDGF